MKGLQLLSFLLLFLFSFHAKAQEMDNQELQKILESVSDTVMGTPGAWEFEVQGMLMLCVTDPANNRMRIITPVAEMKDVSDEQLKAAMEANFHSVLDVKYATSNDFMWVAFIHPLRELSKREILSAITQVYNATATFGTLYSSTELSFPNRKEEEKKKKERKIGKS